MAFCTIITAFALAHLQRGFYQACAPFRWSWRCCRWCWRRGTPEDEHSKPLSALMWHGPEGPIDLCKAFMDKHFRGRGRKRLLNDVIAEVDDDVVRVQRLTATRGKEEPRLDRHGVTFTPSKLTGTTSKGLRKALEKKGAMIHLCRHDPCALVRDNLTHSKRFATVERDELVTIQTSRPCDWLCLPFRMSLRITKCLFGCARYMCGRGQGVRKCCCRRRSPKELDTN